MFVARCNSGSGECGWLAIYRPDEGMDAKFIKFGYCMKKRLSLIIAIASISVLAISPVYADSATEREIKAAYLYHILNFVVWPSESFPKQGEDFEVCLLADEKFEQTLKPIEKKPVKGRTIRVRKLVNIELPLACHLLFIQSEQAIDLKKILFSANQNNILTLGDAQRFVEQGGMIGFVNFQDRVRLEVNLQTINQTDLKVSAKLLEIALHVIGPNGAKE